MVRHPSPGQTTTADIKFLLTFHCELDWFDKHSFEENTVVVDRLLALLANPSTFRPATTIERMHTTLFNRILGVNSKSGAEAEVLDMYMRMLSCHCDATRGDAATLRDYLVFREVDVGMPICMAILYWTEDIVLTPSETALLEPLEHVANYHVSILNDIFSFEREWSAAQNLGEGAVLVNGVRILADETAVSVGMAKRLCFALVRAWEVEFKSMAEDLMSREGMKGNESMRRMVDGIERRMTGAEAFSWRTSRYL